MSKQPLDNSYISKSSYDRPVIGSPFVSLARNLLTNTNESLNLDNRGLNAHTLNISRANGLNYNGLMERMPEGLEKTKELVRNLEKGMEKPQLVPLQSFSAEQLNKIMVPVVKAVQTTVDRLQKVEIKIEKKEKKKEIAVEQILDKQNQIIQFMMQQTEDRKEKKIRLKYKEIQQEFDKIELGLSPDFSKANFMMEELNYLLNRESELQSYNNFILCFGSLGSGGGGGGGGDV